MAVYPQSRPRRLRRTEKIRALVRETTVDTSHLVYPLFVVEGSHVRQEVPSMPGIHRFSVDNLPGEVEEIAGLDIPAVLLFGIPGFKDATATSAYHPEGIVQRAVRAIKKSVPGLLVITDVCLCEYTDHGHCGVIAGGEVDNDLTLPLLAKTALSHAEAGADMVAPSDMMDGRVAKIRDELDKSGYAHMPIMAYSAKYASAFYGPFRDAAESTPQFGDRRAYQMDPPNTREALREIKADIEEGADIVMVKPALPYLDVISRVRASFNVPVAAYNISGEYAMVKGAARNGWLDEKRAVTEVLTAIKRAGADIVITYHAKDFARWTREAFCSGFAGKDI